MSAVSDHIQLMKLQEKKYDSVFNKREWLYINDTVSQYDQGTSIIETTSLSNNSKFVDYNSAYLSVPSLITLTSNDASPSGVSTGMPYNKAVSFKQSFLSMINSITVNLNGQSMIQQNQLIDIYDHFRLLTSESWTSQNRWNTIGFYPDVSTTTSNNSDLNEVLTERLKYILDDTGEILDAVASSALSNLISKTELSKLYVSHISNVSAGTSADATSNIVGKSPAIQYSVKATIMLKDINPLFEVMPISKSLNFKIQIFWNTHNATNWTAQSSQYRS